MTETRNTAQPAVWAIRHLPKESNFHPQTEATPKAIDTSFMSLDDLREFCPERTAKMLAPRSLMTGDVI